MGRYCCVTGCKSGFVSDRRNRDKKKIRQVSLFKIPQCIELRDKWEKALLQKLNTNHFVCENHFREEDILKYHRFFVDGVESIYTRLKWALINKNVVPVNRLNLKKDLPKEPTSKKSQLIEIHHLQPLVLGDNDVKTDFQLNEKFNHIKPAPKKDKLLSVEAPLPSPEILGVNDVRAVLELKEEFKHIETVSNNENSLSVELHHLQPSADIYVLNDVRTGLELKQEFNLQPAVTHSETLSSLSTEFTLEDIKTYFSSVLMEGWCYYATDVEFLFIHMNLLTRMEDKRFSIDKNLSVKVSFSQRPEYSEDVIISSIDDIKTYIEYMSRTILCIGTGINDTKFADRCTGKVSTADYKCWQQYPRCSECRKLRLMLQIKNGKASEHKVQSKRNNKG